MQARSTGLIAWLLAAALVQVAAFEVVRRVFVGTVSGQQLDTAALAGNSIGQGQIGPVVVTVLDAVTVLSVVVAVAAIGFIALMRGRVLLAAVTTAMVVGANVTTQLLKALTARPELGIDLARAAAGNSLPSGHTTVTTSVAVALVLVLPAAVRAPAALIGAGMSGLVGIATLSAGWHRPSDAVAAFLIVGAWTAAAGLALALAGRTAPPTLASRGAHRLSVMTLALLGAGLAIIAMVGLVVTDAALTGPGAPAPEQLSPVRLFVAYAGGAAGIAATACIVMALVLVTVHRVVPPRD